MDVREATADDVEAVRSVHEAAIRGLGPEAYDDDQVDAWAAGVESADYGAVEAEEYHFVVAETDADAGTVDAADGKTDDAGTVVAFGSLLSDPPDEYEASVDVEVTAVYVDPSVARSGVGSAVLTALEARARENEVRTLGLTASANAVPFYEARGYERVGEHDHEFSAAQSTGVSGTVVEMRKEL